MRRLLIDVVTFKWPNSTPYTGLRDCQLAPIFHLFQFEKLIVFTFKKSYIYTNTKLRIWTNTATVKTDWPVEQISPAVLCSALGPQHQQDVELLEQGPEQATRMITVL